MTGLVRDIRQRKFDILIDFQSFRETNLLAGLSGATTRIAMKRHQAAYWGFCFNQPPVAEDKSLHVSAMFERVVASIARSNIPPAVGAVYDRNCSGVVPKIQWAHFITVRTVESNFPV